ncbi:MAG: chemotaxis protein CheW [Burkholderiaceae bacterium]|nr:chemotaxis protein CheW [Burkholderiaceae bacterium]
MTALVKTSPSSGGKSPAAAVDDNKQYLTFMLGGEMFSISILAIKEIIWYANLTDVPMMPDCIRGVINLRGSVVPVMDLSARFGRPSTPVTKSTCIVIIELENEGDAENQHMGVVVDSVQAVLEIPASEIEPAPSFGAKIRPDFIEGIAKVNGKFVILLSVAKVMSTEEISQMAQGVAGADVQQLPAP